MRPFRATPASSYYPSKIHPALDSRADEFFGTLARLVAYVGSLALLAILGVHLWNVLPDSEALEPLPAASWSTAPRAYPAFSLSQFYLPGKTEAYEVFRHPEGGRKDVFHWALSGERPAAELEIYRPGGESSRSGPAIAEIAARMEPEGVHALETAGVIDSKFGPVTLLRLSGSADDAPSCLGFLKRFGDPGLQISGWSCQGETLPARRAAIGCMLNRLMLLTSGNDPKLADLFARAELRRGSCAPAATALDWVTSAENPRLRGAI